MNKHIALILWFILYLFVATNCKNNYGTCEKLVLMDNSAINNDFLNLFNIKKIIPLETSRECMLNSISSIEVVNDTMFVFADQKVFLFGKGGEYICCVGEIGSVT